MYPKHLKSSGTSSNLPNFEFESMQFGKAVADVYYHRTDNRRELRNFALEILLRRETLFMQANRSGREASRAIAAQTNSTC